MDRPRLALVTGASSGIGFELARTFAANGYDVIMTSDNRVKLSAAGRALIKAAPAVDIHMMVADLATPTGAQNLYNEVRKLKRPLDVLANNAGVGVWGRFSETDIRDELAMIQVNIVSLMTLTKLFLPQMLRLHEGKILFTAAEAAVAPAAFLTAYSATKAFVYAFTRGLREELKGSGVTVTALMPGATRSNFFKRAGADHTKVANGRLASPHDVAQAGFDALMQEDDHVVTPFLDKLRLAAMRLQPDHMAVSRLE
jgi:short-subunit dehydrogenase